MAAAISTLWQQQLVCQPGPATPPAPSRFARSLPASLHALPHASAPLPHAHALPFRPHLSALIVSPGCVFQATRQHARPPMPRAAIPVRGGTARSLVLHTEAWCNARMYSTPWPSHGQHAASSEAQCPCRPTLHTSHPGCCCSCHLHTPCNAISTEHHTSHRHPQHMACMACSMWSVLSHGCISFSMARHTWAWLAMHYMQCHMLQCSAPVPPY